jgi:hypothetical protein
MRVSAHAIISTVGFVGLIGPALAAAMTSTEIKALLSGKTAYFETTAASSSGKAGHRDPTTRLYISASSRWQLPAP